MHATANTQWAQATLLSHIKGLSLPGSPTIFGAKETGWEGQASPFARVAFRRLPKVLRGAFSDTLTAYEMQLLVVTDLFWPHPQGEAAADVGLYDVEKAADSLQAELQFLVLDFQDYTVPAAPTTVTDAPIVIERVEIRDLPELPGRAYDRAQVRANARWFGRFDNFMA